MRAGGWCFALLVVLSSPGPRAWGGAVSGRADGLCGKAETAEREARDYERKSEERQRFLKGKGGIASRNGTLPIGGDTAAVRQSAKAKIAEVRALLPQLRQGAAAAARDRGIVPGLSQYFTRLESDLGRMLQAADACLDAPQYCTVPPISCPPVPGMPSFNNSGSASFILQVQQSYAQSANKLRQACQNLNAGIVGDVERLKMGSRSAGPTPGLPGIAPPKPFGDTDLYLRRAENLRREASLSRREADRVSGVRGYCGARSHFRIDAKTSHAVVESLKAAERRRKSEADFPLDAKVIDLKTEWEKKWDKEMTLNAPNGPLPKLTGGEEKSSPVRSAQLPDPSSTNNSTDSAVATPGKPAAKPVDSVELVSASGITGTPALKDRADALAGSDEQIRSAAQGGFDTKGPMLGNPGDIPKVPEPSTVGTAPVAAVPAPKDPPVAPAGSDKHAKTAAKGGSDSKGPVPGKRGDVPKNPEKSPVGAAPGKTAPAFPAVLLAKAGLPPGLETVPCGKLDAMMAAADSLDNQIAERLPMTRALLLNVPKANSAWQKDIEEWTGLQKSAREEAIHQASQNLLDITTGALLAKMKLAKMRKAESLENNIKVSDAWYKSYGQYWYKSYGPLMPEAERVRNLDLIRSLKSDADVLKVIDVTKSSSDIAYESARAAVTPSREANLSLLAEVAFSVVDLVQDKNPAAMLYHNAKTIFIDDVYGWAATLAAKNRMEEIIALQEQGLRDTNRISKMYIDDINLKKTLPETRRHIRAMQDSCKSTGGKQ
jgi:hypothetical protein